MKLINRLIYILFLPAFLITTFPDIAKCENTPQLLPQTIKSASELDYPPFSIIREDGTADGFSVELLKAVAYAVGRDISFEVAPWNKIKQKLIDGHLDALPLVSYSKQRDKVLDFTAPYLRMNGTIFVRKGEKKIRNEVDLKGKEVLVMKDDTAHEYAVRKKLSNKLILTDSFEEALKKLSDGKHDAVIIQQLAGFQLIKKLNISNLVDIGSFQESSLRPVARPLSGFEQKFCIAVPDGDKKLLALLNEGLTLVIANGTYNELYIKWFSPILPKPSVGWALIAKYLILILLPILLFLGIIGIWYLNREVVRKTKHLKEEIKERSQVEDALRESEENLSITLDSIGDAVIATDIKGKIIRMNPVAEHLTGWTLKKAKGIALSKAFNIVNTRTKNKAVNPIGQVLKTGKIVGLANHTMLISKNGDTYQISDSAAPIRDNSGNLIGVVLVFRDVTQEYLIRRAVQESEEKYRLAMDATTDGLWDWNIESEKVYYSPSWSKILEEREVAPTYEAWISRIHSNDKKIVLSTLKDHLEGKSAYWQKEHRLSTKTGKWKWVLGRGRVVEVSENGNPLRMVGTMTDMTDQKKMEAQIRQSQKMESIGTLAGGIAHDFNNILFPIVGHTEMLLQDVPEDSPFRYNLNEIYTSTLRARDLVQQILTFSRQESGKLKLMKMQPVIKEALKLVRATIPATIEINQKIQADCGVIRANSTQIHQVIMNLATNAYHAMEKTGGQLNVTLKEIKLNNHDVIDPNLTPGVYAYLTIADTGRGMKKELSEKIFDPFFTTKKQGKGTGMGLSVVHGIVASMNGAIQVYSEPGKGTKFHVYLPMEKNLSQGHVTNQKKEIQGGTEKVLLVDDEETILTMEKKTLERLGYQVTSCTSSTEALKIFQDSPDKFDLVITDMAMPSMSGDKLAEELVKIRPDIPVLLCTGFSGTMSEEKATSLGIKGFLLKPIVLADLSQKIREVLGENKKTNHYKTKMYSSRII